MLTFCSVTDYLSTYKWVFHYIFPFEKKTDEVRSDICKTLQSTETFLHNVATGKSTTSSSQRGSLPDAAVDGNPTGNWYSKSCFQVNYSDMNPWWQVDLGSHYLVIYVIIMNRVDCCCKYLTVHIHLKCPYKP